MGLARCARPAAALGVRGKPRRPRSVGANRPATISAPLLPAQSNRRRSPRGKSPITAAVESSLGFRTRSTAFLPKASSGFLAPTPGGWEAGRMWGSGTLTPGHIWGPSCPRGGGSWVSQDHHLLT